MFDAMEQFGRESRVPSLWFYGERDELFLEKIFGAPTTNDSRKQEARPISSISAISTTPTTCSGTAIDWTCGFPRSMPISPNVDFPTRWYSRNSCRSRVHPGRTMPSSPTWRRCPSSARATRTSTRKFLARTERHRALVVSQKTASAASRWLLIRRHARLPNVSRKAALGVLYAYDDDVVWTGTCGRPHRAGGRHLHPRQGRESRREDHDPASRVVVAVLRAGFPCRPWSSPQRLAPWHRQHRGRQRLSPSLWLRVRSRHATRNSRRCCASSIRAHQGLSAWISSPRP